MHVLARFRPERPARLLALTGGLVRIVLIGQIGGTNRFGGTVGLVFMIGTVLLAGEREWATRNVRSGASNAQ